MRQGGRGRAVPLPDMPYQHQAGRTARRNPDTPVPARQPYRARRAYQRHSRTPYAPGAGAEPYRHPVCRAGPAGERRVGTLPRPCPTDACTVHDRHAQAAPVPPTRRAPAQSRTVTRFAVPVTGAEGGAQEPCPGRARPTPVPSTTGMLRRHPYPLRAGGAGGERRAAARATPSNRHRRHAAPRSPGGRATPTRDHRRRRRHPRRRAGHASPG
jgi:hypothetical protein